MALENAGLRLGSMGFNLVLLGMNLVLLVVLFGWLDRGRIISPASSRLDRRDLEKLRRITRERSVPLSEGAD